MNRCFGLTRNLHRCGRRGPWRLFCPEHHLQPIGWLSFLIFTAIAGISSIKSAWLPEMGSETCRITATVSSDIVARVYSRARFDPGAAEQVLQPTSQELFYEWKVALVADAPAKDVAFELHRLENDDRVSLQPPSVGKVSAASKHWYSGIPEPNRSKPDYLVRTVLLPALSPESPPTAVVVRRPLEKPSTAPGALIGFDNAHSANCRIIRPTPEASENAEYLRNLAVHLAGNVYKMAGEVGVPLKPDPGDVGEHETQATVEVRCKDENCATMQVGQLEARLGKSPQQYATERTTEGMSQNLLNC